MILDLLKKRSSVRRFINKKIPCEVIEEILEAGRLSPSGGNEQPWFFGVINDQKVITDIADAAYKQTWIKTAPLLIVMCTKVVSDERGARGIQMKRFPQYAEHIARMDKELYSLLNLEEHQTKIPGSHMILCALEHQIYSTWVSYFDVKKVSSLLKLPPNIIASEIIVFGYPESEPKHVRKKEIEEITFYNSF